MQPNASKRLSIIVPVHDGGPHLARCLDALLDSDFSGGEIIVVDDCSKDLSAEVARARGVKVVSLEARRGPAAARNAGARRARGNVLLFIDSDVVVHPDTLARVEDFFNVRPDTAAVFGSYDDEPDAPGFVSQYKNLAHHFIHQRSNAEAETFWAGCGAIRREAFERVGGFDEARYARPSIEDIELGRRLRRAGFLVTLDRGLQVKHLKRWTLASLLRADVRDRAVPWSRLILEEGSMPSDLNLRASDRASAALACAAALLLASSAASLLFQAGLYAATLACAAAPALVAFVLLNLPLLRFMRERRGAAFALASALMLALYYLYSASAFAFCCSEHLLNSARALFQVRRRAGEPGRVEDA